jgi:hypothetical protein
MVGWVSTNLIYLKSMDEYTTVINYNLMIDFWCNSVEFVDSSVKECWTNFARDNLAKGTSVFLT